MTTFLALSKTLPQLFLPVGLSLLLQALALGLSLRRRRRGALVSGLLGLLVLWLPATPRVADALLGALERRHPAVAASASAGADVIIILGGGTSGRSPEQPEVELQASGNRLLHGFRLYKQGKAPLLLLSGGSLWPGMAEAEQMRQILAAWGVPAAAMLLEANSRNTHENAVESLRLMRERGLRRALLVTSAFHMPRAMAIFQREAGREGVTVPTPALERPGAGEAATKQAPIEILAAATGALVNTAHPRTVASYLPEAGALANSTLALRERLGMVVYGLRGWL